MRQSLRPYISTGIAIAGAGIIAVTPIAPPTPERSVEFSSVHLAAAELPGAVQTLDTQSVAEAYQNLIIMTGAYMSDAFVPFVTNPTPILNQLRANQFAYLNYLAIGITYGAANSVQILADMPGVIITAATQLRAGDAEAAILTLWSFVEYSVQLVISPFIQTLQIPGMITQNIANVAATIPTMVLQTGLDAFETVSNTVRTTAASVQSIVDAAGSGNPLALANAIALAPAEIATALLVGDLAEGGDTPGLINGLFKNLVLARQTIAEALGAPPLEAPEERFAAVTAEVDSVDVVSTGGDTTPPSPAATDEDAVSEPAEEPTEPAALVRDSFRAVPGENATGARTLGNPRTRIVKTVSDDISAAATKIGDGIKKAFTKPSKKAAANAGSGDNAGSGSGSNDSAGSGESG
ncbi:hypothetical protein [Mycolicibacterium sp. XJ870]